MSSANNSTGSFPQISKLLENHWQDHEWQYNWIHWSCIYWLLKLNFMHIFIIWFTEFGGRKYLLQKGVKITWKRMIFWFCRCLGTPLMEENNATPHSDCKDKLFSYLFIVFFYHFYQIWNRIIYSPPYVVLFIVTWRISYPSIHFLFLFRHNSSP